MQPAQILYLPYIANIVILVPVVYAMLFGSGTVSVFEGKVSDSDGLRILVGSLWLAILIGSALGLIWPKFFAPLLLVQIIYKATWLGLFIWPLMRAGLPYPTGISIVFAAIVVTYPLFFWLAFRG